MKAEAIISTGQTVVRRQHSRSGYSKVFDQRKRRVRGLWERNGTFYAQMTVIDEASGRKAVRRTRLEDAEGRPVATVAEAVKVMNKLKVKQADHGLSLAPKRTPSFAEWCDPVKTGQVFM